MQKFCPNEVDQEQIEEHGQAEYRCGLCRGNDYDITSALCRTKLKATSEEAIPGRTNHRLTTQNRFTELAMTADLSRADLDEEKNLQTQTFARTYGTCKMAGQRQSRFSEEEFPPLVDRSQVSDYLGRQIAEVVAQLEQLRRKRARIEAQHRSTHAVVEDRTPPRREAEGPIDARKALEDSTEEIGCRSLVGSIRYRDTTDPFDTGRNALCLILEWGSNR